MRSVKFMRAAKTSYIVLSALYCVFGVLLIAVPDFSMKPVSYTHLENVAAVSDRPVGGAFNGRKALVHRCTRLTCHSEERSDVGISQYLAG